ncbi:unnamed protein product [Rhizoctonia solani]|uniref:Uncharacterized protein n=1 Tax=Rhizoctonia solani TaxID=456999 RepID=A0A8H3DIQ8_9AGAM|nr:unnamed protein product [Rhizoctonia solani]
MPPRRRGRSRNGDADDDDYYEEELQLKRIDTDLPEIVMHDIQEWNERFDNLQDEHGTRQADIFGATGVYTERGQRYRAGLDFDRHRVTRDNVVLTTSCDIDSVIAVILRNLPIHPRANFGYYMLAAPNYTLTDNLSIPKLEIRQGDDVESIPIHHVPNARFGKMGRFVIYVFFPVLYDPEVRKQKESPNVMNDDYMALFYDLAVRVATDLLIPEDQLDELEFARGIFLVVDGKGFKENNLSSHHPPSEVLVDEDGDLVDPENQRTVAIEAIFENCFVPADFVEGEWYLDIATNVSGHLAQNGAPISLFVNSDLHPEILNHFTGQPLNECARWVRRGSHGYVRDEVAHISKFAGLHQTFDFDVDHAATKLQVYTTDKGVTYRPDFGKKAIRTSPLMCMKAWSQESEEHFRRLAEVYLDAPGAHTVAAQFESRVPFESYPYVHLKIRARTFRPWLFWVRNTAFWGFKWRRLNTFWNVLEEICGAEKARTNFSLKRLSEVGSLVILLSYMTNALVNRPDDGGHFDEVHDSGCIHEIINYQLVPVIQLGYYIIHSLRFPHQRAINSKLPRISSQRTISNRTIIYLFATQKDERNELHVLRLFRNDNKRPADDANDGDPWGIVPQRPRITYPHTSNKQRVTLSLPGPIPNVLAARLPDQELYEAYSSEEEDNEVRERVPELSRLVERVIYTYPLQIIAKLPNRRDGKGSWSSLNANERTNASFDLFCDASAPSRIFVSWNNFGRDGPRWDSTLTAFFPSLKQLADMGKIQGLSQLSVRSDWSTIIMSLSTAGEEKAIKEAKDYVSEHWKWLPYYTKKKLWVTGEPPETRIPRQVGRYKGGPWIIFNPRFHN